MPIATVNPATGQLVRSFKPLTNIELERKLQKAADAFRNDRLVPFATRAQWMVKAAEIPDPEKG